MFSWFCISSVNKTYRNTRNPPNVRQISGEIITNTLEAISIIIADPALNRKRESLESAYEAIQKSQSNPKAIRRYLQDILDKIDDL